jgi:uridine kinase
MERAELLTAVWEAVPRPGRPVLLAIDGPDGAGKSRFAADLASRTERPVVVAALDDFHHPREWRHGEGRTGATVWARTFDYAAIRRELVDPWRAGAGTPYRPRWHDLATDTYPDVPQSPVPAEGVLVVEGVFAQRPELADAWDLVVYVDAPDEVRVSRMAARDGVPEDARDPAHRRYLEAQQIYLEACRPLEAADIVVDNADPRRPRIVSDAGGTGAGVHNDQS